MSGMKRRSDQGRLNVAFAELLLNQLLGVFIGGFVIGEGLGLALATGPQTPKQITTLRSCTSIS